MIGATLSRASAARRRCTPALAGLGLVALAATACGGGGTTSTPTAASNSPAASNSTAPAGAQAAFPGVVGTAAAVSGSSMEVQNPTNGQVTVTFSTATAITETVTTTSKDVTVGSCVAVVGQSSASGATTRSVAATTVTISTPVNGSCNAAAGFGFGGFGGRPRGTFSPRPGFTPRPRPSGSRGAFGAGGFGGANGTVTSLSASGFVVHSRNPRSPDPSATASITVTTSSATKYLKVVTARPSALKVGQCIIAVGQANSIGTVAARTIRISQPGPNGCVAGFGRRGGFGGGGSGGATSNA